MQVLSQTAFLLGSLVLTLGIFIMTANIRLFHPSAELVSLELISRATCYE